MNTCLKGPELGIVIEDHMVQLTKIKRKTFILFSVAKDIAMNGHLTLLKCPGELLLYMLTLPDGHTHTCTHIEPWYTLF